MHVKSNLSDLLGLSSNPATQSASNLITRKTSSAGASSVNTDQAADDGLDDADASGGTDAEKTFLDYMKEPVAKRMEDAWLKAHNLTEADLESMPPDQREAIVKEMEADIKAKMQEEAQQKAQATTPAQASSAAGLATLLTSSI